MEPATSPHHPAIAGSPGAGPTHVNLRYHLEEYRCGSQRTRATSPSILFETNFFSE